MDKTRSFPPTFCSNDESHKNMNLIMEAKSVTIYDNKWMIVMQCKACGSVTLLTTAV